MDSYSDLPRAASPCLDRSHRLAPLAGLIVCLLVISGCGGGDQAPDLNDLGQLRKRFDPSAPNVVVVMTDDQAIDTMRAMPSTRKLVGGRGVTFKTAIASFPLCCPSRAAFLTGQYAHNNGVRDNGPPDGGIGALDQRNTLPVWLRDAGYQTTFVGKYLNGYGKNSNGGPLFVPPGWTDWHALTAGDKTSAYGYQMSENGTLVDYGSDPADYKTSVMTRIAVKAINEQASSRRPFFLWVATSDPHTDSGLGPNARRNPLPAKRDIGSFKDLPLPKPPSFNEREVADKSSAIASLPSLSPEQHDEIRTTFISQVESLRSVDRLVRRVVNALRRAGELDDTLVVFTSDNGFMRGQHRIDSGKSLAYEESIRVPLLIAGPGFRGERTVHGPVANIDLAPTILRATGTSPSLVIDGEHLQGTDERQGVGEVLIEIYGRRQENVFGVRTPRFSFFQNSDGESELYDLRRDPFQLHNLAGKHQNSAVQRRIESRLDLLRNCRGRSCRIPR